MWRTLLAMANDKWLIRGKKTHMRPIIINHWPLRVKRLFMI